MGHASSFWGTTNNVARTLTGHRSRRPARHRCCQQTDQGVPLLCLDCLNADWPSPFDSSIKIDLIGSSLSGSLFDFSAFATN